MGWYAVCGALLAGHLPWLIALREDRSPLLANALGVGLGALIIVMIALLWTTPRDAIRLPRRRSELLILGGVFYLQMGAMCIGAPERNWLADEPWPAARTLVAVLLATALFLRLLRMHDRSAWWAAVVAWNPLAVYATGVAGQQWVVWVAVALAALALVSGRPHQRMTRPRGVPPF